MRILLIYPSRVGRGNIPINIPILQAVLKRAGHEVRIFDANNYRWTQWGMLQTKMGMFKKTDEDKYNQMLFETDIYADFEDLLKEFSPHVVAVSCLTTDFLFSLSLVRIAKKAEPSVVSLYGGIHPTIAPDQVISHQEVDYVCIGEGEDTIVEFIDRLERGKDFCTVRNVVWKKGDTVIKNELRPLVSLNDIPFQDYSGFEEFHFYRAFDGMVYKMAGIEISRGCLFPCSYCVNQSLRGIYKGLGTYHRVKAIQRAIEEIVFLKNTYNFEFIRFWDEDFTSLSREFLKDFSQEYIRQVNLPFLVYARCETITDEKVEILKDMGCKTFAVGIESGNEWIRKNILNRNVSDQTIVDKINIIHKYDVRVSAYNMIGLPFETRQAIFDTIHLNRVSKTSTSSVVFLEPYPATKIMDILIQENLIPPNYIAEYRMNEPHFIPKGMTKQELIGLLKTFPLYLKLPHYMFSLIKICEGEGFLPNVLQSLLRNIYLK